MRPLSHLKHWKPHSIEHGGQVRRVYLPIAQTISSSDLKRMKRGYAPKDDELEVHHMGRQDGSFLILPKRLHQGHTPIEVREPSPFDPNDVRVRTTTVHKILHNCPPITPRRQAQLQQLVMNQDPWSFGFRHQAPPPARHDAAFERWKSTIWRGYATYLERLQHGLPIVYALPHPKEDSVLTYFMREASRQWEHLKGKLSHNEDAHRVVHEIRVTYPVLDPRDIFHGIVRYLLI
ncbi:MAG: hypothetical protein ACK551_03415 [Vampirovibrionales bacterium]